jgi:hypothetical protein
LKRFLTLFLILAVMLVSAGCGVLADKMSGNEEKQQNKEKKSEDVEAVSPNKTYKEISFQRINWIMGAPDPESSGGIWVYNKDKHPAGLDDQDWDHEDMLYVQASSPTYDDKDITIEKLQVIQDDIVKIVVSMEDSTDTETPARDWASVETGELDGKKFIVETTDGKRVKTQ